MRATYSSISDRKRPFTSLLQALLTTQRKRTRSTQEQLAGASLPESEKQTKLNWVRIDDGVDDDDDDVDDVVDEGEEGEEEEEEEEEEKELRGEEERIVG